MPLHSDSELEAVADNLIRFIDREVVPLEADNSRLLDEHGAMYGDDGRIAPAVLALKREVRMRSAAAGFYTLFGASELGGGGFGARAFAYLQDAIQHRYGPARPLIHTVVLPSPFTNGLSPVLRHLPPDTFALYRDDISSGRKTLCFALSEPDAGSDVFAISTQAVRDGDDWVLTGTKQWITNAPYADLAMVFAVTDPEAAKARRGGITGFLVDTGAPGFSVPGVIRVMGHKGGDTGIVALDGVRVRDDHRLGPVDRGLSVALGGVSAGRLGMSASALGMARWALDKAVAYAGVRRTFGKPIAEHQAIQFMLADCAIDIYAAQAMINDCAALIDAGTDAVAQTSIVKAFCTEMVGRVVDRAIQVHGGMGLANETGLEAAFRTARIFRIPDGTGEIQRRTIAGQLLAGKARL
jgi:acyl-CoA dehydrogenase